MIRMEAHDFAELVEQLGFGIGEQSGGFSGWLVPDCFFIFNILLGSRLKCSGQEGKQKIRSDHEGQYPNVLDWLILTVRPNHGLTP